MRTSLYLRTTVLNTDSSGSEATHYENHLCAANNVVIQECIRTDGLLLENLQCVGVSGSLLTWFEDYLAGQFQRVVLDGHTSAALSVTSGIPQGLL